MTIICPKILILYLFEVLAFCCHVTISLNRCHSVHVPGKSVAMSTAEGAEFVFQSLDWLVFIHEPWVSPTWLEHWSEKQQQHISEDGGRGDGDKNRQPSFTEAWFCFTIWQYFERWAQGCQGEAVVGRNLMNGFETPTLPKNYGEG